MKDTMVTVGGHCCKLTSHLPTLSICNIYPYTVLYPVFLSGCINAVSLSWEVFLETRSEELGRKNEEEEKARLRVHYQTGHHDRHLALSISANV